MVPGVPRGVHRGEDATGGDGDLLTVGEHVDALGGRGVETSVERIEQRAVDAGRGIHQARRVGEVAGALLVHVHGGPGKGAGDVAHATGVVEMDVGHGHTRQVGGAHAQKSSTSRRAGTELWLPVSTRTGAVPASR